MDFLFLSFLSFFFWFFQKIADWHDEHWLNFFKWAWIFFWIIWWTIWYYLVVSNNLVMITHLAIVLYWIYKLKIDYINHAISIIIILFWVFLSSYWIQNYYYVLGLLIFYIGFDFIKLKFRKKYKYLNLFFNYRLHFIIIPIIFSALLQNIFWIVIIFNLLWISAANRIFKIK